MTVTTASIDPESILDNAMPRDITVNNVMVPIVMNVMFVTIAKILSDRPVSVRMNMYWIHRYKHRLE